MKPNLKLCANNNMPINKILCVGDGYAHGHIWPEWPQLLQALFPNHCVDIISGIGAGPEYLVTQFVDQLPVTGPVIFQWPEPQRLDKIIENNHWRQAVESDPIYHFNTYQHQGHEWWLSSATTNEDVKKYHAHYIQPAQAQKRLVVYQRLIQEILEKSNCQYIFTTTQEQETHSQTRPDIRGTEIQPSPLSHFYFLTEKILPVMNLQSSYANELEKMLKQQHWQAYDPDRQEIWKKIKNQLWNTLR